ncbi:polycystic kidney disease protein 1-like 2, partial [Plakobranchus ocellatus]
MFKLSTRTFVHLMTLLGMIADQAGGQHSRLEPQTLTYVEDGQELFVSFYTPSGCHAYLDSYPHWCLGNISRCDQGISVLVQIRLDSGVTPDHPAQVILTSGGHNPNGDGFYISRKLADQYTIGVALKEDIWRTTFRLISDTVVTLGFTWHENLGLQIYVDGLQVETIASPEKRVTNPEFDGSSSAVMVGVSEFGFPDLQACTYNVKKIDVVNARLNAEAFRTDYNMSGPLFMGCLDADFVEDFYIDTRNIIDISPETQCRILCHSEGKIYSVVRNAVSCTCVNHIDSSQLSYTSCEGKYEAYYVTRVTHSHSYNLVLNSESQSENPYTKPGEDFLFSASLGLKNVEVVYRFDFDDGITVTTTTPPVSHSWLLDGVHHVNVTASLGIVTVLQEMQVTVEDVDEGRAPDVVGLTIARDVTMPLSALYSVRMFDDHTTDCKLSYGDGDVSNSFTVHTFGQSVNMQHNYSVCGLYEVKASCDNTYGNSTARARFYATEMYPEHTILMSGDNFSIPTYGDKDFLNSIAVKLYNTINIGYSVIKDSVVYVETSELVDGVDNEVTLVIKDLSLDRHVLSVRQPVKKPQIMAERTSSAWNLTAIFTIQLDVSDHVWMTINYGSSEPHKVFYLPAILNEIQLFDSAIYPTLGDYRMTVRLQNEMSSTENFLDISVEVPIESLSVDTYNITSLQEEAAFTFDVNMGSISPQKVVFTIDFGDGNVKQIFYRNKKANGFEPLNLRYQYAAWGIYRVKVTAGNNISHVVENVIVHVGENITFIDILTETERVLVGGTIDFILNCPTGSDVEYFLNFGDGTNFTVGELSGPEDSRHSNASAITETFIRVSHVFNKPGTYHARVTVMNTFGSMSADLCPTLSVTDIVPTASCQEPSVSFRDMMTSLDMPLVRKRSVDTLVVVDATFDCSSHDDAVTAEVTYSWKGVRLDSVYADEIENMTLADYTEKTISTYCTFKTLDNFLSINALDLPFGLYRLTVTVSPLDNDLLFTTKHLYIRIIQSEPRAIIEGEDFRTIMRYATAIFDISSSFDPDLVENVRLGLSYYLFFMPQPSLKTSKTWSMSKLLEESSFIAERTLFTTDTQNPFFMYQYGSCFNESAGLTMDLQTYEGKIKFHADSFSQEHISFGVLLWVERNGLSSVADQTVEVRSTNVSLEDLSSLLDLAMNADPDTAIRLCGGAASAILNQEASSADAQEALAESTEAVVKTLGSVASRIDSPNQAATCASAIKTMTSNKDIVSEGSRASAAGAFVSLANGTSNMKGATVDDASNFAGEALGGLGNIFPTAPEKSTAPKRRSSTPEVSTTTTELLGLMASRMANNTDEFGYTTPFTTKATGSTGTTISTRPTSRPTSATPVSTTTASPTTTTTASTYPTTTTQTVITTPTTTIIHTTVGTTLSPAVKATFVDNGDNYTISGITVATLRLNASREYGTTPTITTTTTTATTTTTEAPTTTPVTIPIHPMMYMPRNDPRTSWEIAEELLNSLPEKKTYDELLYYIFDDCLLFRRVMKTAEIQHNCPCISAEAINMMKCDGDFSLQERVFDIMTFYEHPDDLYEAYLVPLDRARDERDKKRKETDKTVAKSGQEALGTVSNVVGSKTSEDDRTERSFETPRLGMKLAKVGVSNATNGTDTGAGKQKMSMPVGDFDMPTNVLKGSAGGCSNVDTLFMGDTDNPFTYAQGNNTVGKGVLSLGYSCNGQPMPVEAAEEPILLWMERDANAYEHSLFVLSTNTKEEVWTNFNYHNVTIDDKNSSLQIVLQPTDEVAEYYVYFKVGERPNMTYYDFIGISPNDKATLLEGYDDLNDTQKEQLRYSVQIPLDMTSSNGTYWIGVKFKSGNIAVEEEIVNTSYTLLHLLSGCRFFDETNDTWSSDGCVVGELTTKYKTQCFCDHLTSFGSDAAMAPNTIDFNNVWAQFDLSENAAVFSTVIVLIGIYIILLVWLRHMDKKDLKKWGALPLEDNLPTDSYHYQFTIQTGVKSNAGTDSQIRFIVSGEEGDSGVRRLAVADGERKHIPRGSIFNYVMSVDSCLGPLTFLRIWHDNSGKGKKKSWYLDQVQINDLQTGEKFIFLCDNWLAVEQGDGMVDRILPVAGIDDLVAFKQLFSSSARKKLANDHLWLSVFSRPTRSNFTRVQRLSCCMSLLFLTMITNAMWFRGETNQENVEAIKLGPVSFTLTQFFIGFASTLIVFPPNFVMMTFFRRCRPKNNAIAQVNQPEVKDKQKFRWKNVNSSSMIWGPKAKKSRLRKLKESVSNILTIHKKNRYSDDIPVEETEKDDEVKIAKPKKKKPWSLPHWCIYIAWVLCFFSIVASGFFTILYSMQWGKEKSNEWLTTFLLSFFQSVIIVQPIKVLLLVAFIACILKKPDLDEEDLDEDINKVLAGRSASSNKDEASLSQIMLQRRTDNSEFQPPDPEELEKSRKNRLMEIKMEAVLKEIAVYTFFLGVIFFLSYQQRDPQSYALGDTIRKNMLSGHEK